ncbi:MAG: carboxymuconolactone decarboxylase family protein [Elusimicrobiota bacterium]
MKDIHKIFKEFKEEFSSVYGEHVELGKKIHLDGGPIDDKNRWLIKIAISAASGHHKALETHIEKARKFNASEAQIKHVILLLMPTCGFPATMEAYETYKKTVS